VHLHGKRELGAERWVRFARLDVRLRVSPTTNGTSSGSRCGLIRIRDTANTAALEKKKGGRVMTPPQKCTVKKLAAGSRLTSQPAHAAPFNRWFPRSVHTSMCWLSSKARRQTWGTGGGRHQPLAESRESRRARPGCRCPRSGTCITTAPVRVCVCRQWGQCVECGVTQPHVSTSHPHIEWCMH
jgi:hypothetical protein